MPQIDYINNEAPALVQEIGRMFGEDPGDCTLVVINRRDSMHLLTNGDLEVSDFESARLQIEGLLEHFDELIAQARKNGEANS